MTVPTEPNFPSTGGRASPVMGAMQGPNPDLIFLYILGNRPSIKDRSIMLGTLLKPELSLVNPNLEMKQN